MCCDTLRSCYITFKKTIFSNTTSVVTKYLVNTLIVLFFFKLTFNQYYSVFVLEYFTKNTLNNSFIATFYMFWINQNYLVNFVTLIVVGIFSCKLSFQKSFLFPLYMVVFYFYILELEDFIFTNQSITLVNPSTSFFNVLLTNLLNKYHPIIFYCSCVFLFYLVWSNFFLKTEGKKFISMEGFLLWHTTWPVVFIINLSSLFLGSWWALQEGTWGGWWNWDPSETFGLVVLVAVTLLLHSNFSLTNTVFFVFKKHALLLIFLVSYFFIQLNFEIVSHNFNFKIFYFFNNNNTLFQFILVYLIVLLFVSNKCHNYFKWFYNTYLHKINRWWKASRFFLYLSLVIFISSVNSLIFSYLSIFSFFSWNFFKIPISFINFSIKNFYWFIIVLLLFRFHPPSLSPSFYSFFLVFDHLSIVQLFSLFLITTSSLHQLIALLFLINWLSYFFDFISWEYLSTSVDVFVDIFIAFEPDNLFFVTEGVVESMSLWKNNLPTFFSSWISTGLTNSFEISNFFLLSSHSNLYNFYYNFHDTRTYFTLIEINNLNSLILTLLYSVSFFLFQWKNFYLRKKYNFNKTLKNSYYLK